MAKWSAKLAPVSVCVLLAGCSLPKAESPPASAARQPVAMRAGYAPGTLVRIDPPANLPDVADLPVRIARAAAPTGAPLAPPVIEVSARKNAEALLTPQDADTEWITASAFPALMKIGPTLRAPILIREESTIAVTIPATENPDVLPGVPVPPSATPASPVPPKPTVPATTSVPIIIPVDPPSTKEPPSAMPTPRLFPTPASVPVVPAKPLPPLPTKPTIPAPMPLQPVGGATQSDAPVPPSLPAIPAVPATMPPAASTSAAPAKLPALPGVPPPSEPLALPTPAGPISVGGRNVTFDALSQMVDGSGCGVGGGCSSCGGDCGPGRPCPAGGRKCEPFPATNHFNRFIGMVYEGVCCPDPCYQPRWEPIADTAFFVDAPRPRSGTRFRWDYGDHLSYPDRGEVFWARADGKGKGPKATDPRVLAVPFVDYHELSLVTEIATGSSSVAVSVPYRTVNTTPFGKDSAGFSDMTITAKSLLMDSELFLAAMQMRTYIPTGNFGKGLGVGHLSLEPGLVFGLRCSPRTYLQAEVLEWIPLGADMDYAGAHLRWGLSVNHILWRPVKDVQLIGTMELTGMSFQDGLFTDPMLGPQKLSGQNNVAAGTGIRMFFCESLDIGVAGNFGITGKYFVRDQMRFEMRFRY